MPGSDEREQPQDPGRRAFVPRWRQRTPEPAASGEPVADSGVHPNLQSGDPAPASGSEPAEKPRRFQPRWRQRAEELAAREKQQQETAPTVEEQVAQLGFQPRWRRTAGPQPTPAAAQDNAALQQPEPAAPEKPRSGRFQPRWRERVGEQPPAAEPAGGESPAAAPQARSRFVPRWRQRTGETTSAAGPDTPGEAAPGASPPAPDKGFVPRWRQRASPAAGTEAADAASPAPLEAGARRFAPRWRRTSGPAAELPAQPPAESPAPAEVEPGLSGGAPGAGGEPGPSPGLAAHLRARAQRLRELEKAAREAERMRSLAPPAAAAPADALALPLPELPDLPEPARDTEEPAPVAAVPQPESMVDPPPAAIPEPAEATGPLAEAGLAAETTVQPVGLSSVQGEPAAAAESSQSEPNWFTELPPPSAPPLALALGAAAGPDLVEQPVPEPEVGDGDAEPAPAPELPAPRIAFQALPLQDEEPEVTAARPEPSPPPAPALPDPTEVEVISSPSAPAAASVVNVAPARHLPPPTPAPVVTPQYRNPVLQAAQQSYQEPPRSTPPPAAPRYSPPPVVAQAPPPPPVATRGPLSAAAVAAPPPKSAPAPKSGRERSIPAEEVATFTRQLSVMIGAGLPLHQALNFFAESGEGPIAKVADTLANKIASGFRLSAAMAQFPAVFSDVYVGLIELGETTSHIDEALERLADLMEKQVRLAKRLSSALVYPAFLVMVCLASIGVFLHYVLPTLIPLFQSFSLQLPWPTRMLLMSRHLVWPGLLLSVTALLAWRWFKPVWGRARRQKSAWAVQVDRALLRLPVIGKFTYQLATARILFALATMLETGLPLLNAMKRCESVASNLDIAARLERAGAALKEGGTVSESLEQHDVLPPACVHLMAAGEESAHLAEMVQYAARFYEEEVDQSIAQFMSLVEPAIMIVMGLVVAFIVLSAVLPTVQMINQLGV